MGLLNTKYSHMKESNKKEFNIEKSNVKENNKLLTKEYFNLLNYDRTILKLHANASLYKYIKTEFKTYDTLSDIVNCPGFDIENISQYIKEIGHSLLKKSYINLTENEVIVANNNAKKAAEIFKKSINHNISNLKYYNINCNHVYGVYFIGGELGYLINKDIVNEVYFSVLKKDGLMLQYIDNSIKTYDMCLEAYKQNKKAFVYFPECIKAYPNELIKEAGL